jgi:hypothetical protein
MRFWSVIFAVTWSLLVGTSAAYAAKRVALVIGNSSYTNAPTLANPKNDAEDVSAALRDLGFDVVEGRDLDRREMADAVRRFSRKLPGSEVALFFYAGHGVQVSGNNYLLPTDVTVETSSDIKLGTIDVGTILEEMESEQRVNLIFLDACRDNPFANSLLKSSRSLPSRGLSLQDSGVGSLIAYATQPNNIAFDGKGRNSPFTQALLKHLKTPGLEVRTMLARVRGDVIDSTGGKQVPWENSSLRGEVYLKPSQAAETEAKPESLKSESTKNNADAELAFWQSSERIGTKGAFEAYKRAFGNQGRYSALADERIAALSPSSVTDDVPSKPTGLTNVMDTADKKRVVRSRGTPKPPQELTTQARQGASERKFSSRSEPLATRTVTPLRAIATPKKEERPVTRQARAPARPQPVARGEPQGQTHATPAVEQAEPVIQHRPRLGIGLGLIGLGLGGIRLGIGH